MDVIFELPTSHKLDAITLFQAIMQALRTLFMNLDGMDMIFKLTTSPSMMSLFFPRNFKFKNS